MAGGDERGRERGAGATVVRRLRTDEVDAWRELRMAMLTDAPWAFGSTLAEALATSREAWVERARGLAEDRERAMFVADQGGRLLGSAGVFMDPGDGGRPHLVAMWVRPAERGRGLGARLVAAAVEWARGSGAGSIRLFVVDHNASAMRLYEGLGFSRTGHLIPYPHDPAVMEVEMSLEFSG